MCRSTLVWGLGVVFFVGEFATDVSAQQAKRGQQQAVRANQQNQVAPNANGAAAAVQLLLQQFDRNGNRMLDGDELVQVAAAFQQLIVARAAEAGAGGGGMQGGGAQGFGNANGGNQQALQQRFRHGLQHGQGGGAGAGGNGGHGAGRR